LQRTQRRAFHHNPQTFAKKLGDIMSNLFYLVLIAFLMVSPLIVPVSVEIYHAIKNLKQLIASTGAVGGVRAVPAAA
jgi:PhoPQ-activated pathogenicity-related protein